MICNHLHVHTIESLHEADLSRYNKDQFAGRARDKEHIDNVLLSMLGVILECEYE